MRQSRSSGSVGGVVRPRAGRPYPGSNQLYVDAQIARGKKHSTAVRSLAFKWIRIMAACWKQGEPYDDAQYLRALQRKNSPLAANLPAAA